MDFSCASQTARGLGIARASPRRTGPECPLQEGSWLITLAEGESLEFDVTRGPKGLQAANVRKA